MRSSTPFPARARPAGALACLVLLAACSPPAPGAVPPPAPLPKVTPLPAATPIQPTAAAPPSPTLTPLPTTTAPCPVVEQGGLISELDRIAGLLPGPGSQGMILPDEDQLAAWEQVLGAIADGSLQDACNLILARGLPYQLVRFTDLPFQDDQVLLLREQEPLAAGWGTYVFRPRARRDLVIEVPHPLEDSYTRGEGITLFRELGAKALLVAGAHRCADDAYSTCGGTTIVCGQVEPYRVSDVAHSVRTPFHAAHRVWADCRSATIVLQLHGNDLDTCPDLFVSNGTRRPGDLARAVARNAGRQCAPLTVDLADGSPENECGFIGNGAQAAYTLACSGSADGEACPDAPTRSDGPDRYLSLEQSPALRLDFACLVPALDDALP